MTSKSTGDEGPGSPSLLTLSISLRNLSRTLGRSTDAIGAREVILLGHLGLGDQIALAACVEAWSSRAHRVLLPTKPMNVSRIKAMFGYLPNVQVLQLESDDPAKEVANVWAVARQRKAHVVDGSRSIYAWASDAFPELGMNRALALACLYAGPSIVSHPMKAHLLSLNQIEPPSTPYAVVDHHPGTVREIPRTVLDGIVERGFRIVPNPRDQPLEATALLMERASELHLVSSAPACLAMTADLGSGWRARYRANDNDLSKADYPMDWREIRLAADGSSFEVDRLAEALPSPPSSIGLLPGVARRMFLKAIESFDSAPLLPS